MKNGKTSYDVLESLPKSTILSFYIKSIFIGVWVSAKWIVFLLWSAISKKKSLGSNHEKNDYDGYHDKPPSILVDNKIGRHSYVKLMGVKLHYVEAGQYGDPLVLLLHGFPDCWLGWRNQITELSRFFRVVALDMKGFNDSDKPIWRQLYTPRTICDELRQFIHSLGCSSVTIIGHDIGAIVGWFFAHTNPGNVDRFISVSAPHPNLMWDSLQPKSVMNTTWLQFIQLPVISELDHSNSFSVFLEKCLKSDDQKDNSKAVISLRKSVDTNFDTDFKFNVLDTYKYVFNRRSDWSGPFNYYRNFPFYRIKEGDTIRSPVLIITGSTDDRCRLEYMVKSTDFCDNFVLKIIEGAGHWPHQQLPDEFNKVILNFLVGKRAAPEPAPIEKNSKGLVGRMLGAVSTSVKLGSSVLDSVQQRTNNLTAIHNEPVDPFF